MSDTADQKNLFNRHRICVIIPTYNNVDTLPDVIADVAKYSQNIIVVNDGSTDNTLEVLNNFTFLQVVSYSKNQGKGFALRSGFSKAAELGYHFAITIDSDGQHFAKDLPLFTEKLNHSGAAIIIGARNMNQTTVPGKSSFGNRFSTFWFKLETGINTPDTQSGYRLYPVERLKKIRFLTRKYEFEIEVLVRAAWSGIEITSVPVSVYYAPKEKRVSHFRPIKDFVRISLLNTVLVLIAFLYIKPRDFIKSVFRKEKWELFFREQLLNINEPHYIKASSIALGICMGILPIWGFQLITAIFLSFLLRLNKALVIIAANISIPPMIPMIIYLSYKAGAIWMHGSTTDMSFSDSLTLESVKNNFQQYFYGGITLAVVSGVVCGLLTWVLLTFFSKKTRTAI